MTDETTPKRVRGLKEREAAYRAGYHDGYSQGAIDEATREATQKIADLARERQMADGLKRLRAEPSAPKRTRRKKGAEEKRLDDIAMRRDAALDAG